MTVSRYCRLTPVLVALIALAIVIGVPASHAQARSQPQIEGTPRRLVLNLTFAPAKASDQLKSGKGRMTIELSGSRCTEYKMIRHTVADLQFAADGCVSLAH